MTQARITKKIAQKVLETVDAGLCKGVGIPVPGQMCVEAAVCYAMGQPHGDDPSCVAPAVRQLKITLNDATWSSNQARAKGMRRLALVQLGSADAVDEQEFAKRCARLAIQTVVPAALLAAASVHPDSAHVNALTKAAEACKAEGTEASASAARSAASAAWSAARSAARSAAESAARSAAESAARSAAESAAESAAAVRSAARDKILADFGEGVVQVLVDMKAPGAKWLTLAPKE